MDRLLRLQEVLQIVPFCQPHLYRLMKRGEFPRQIRIGANRVAWRESDIRAWVESKGKGQSKTPSN
jgi:prophage regulatory protein